METLLARSDESIQRQLQQALQIALRDNYPAPLGVLLAAAVDYRPQTRLDVRSIKAGLETDTAVILEAVVRNQFTGATMRQLQAAVVACALLGDKAGLERWAQEGLNRCKVPSNGWTITEEAWRWLAANASSYILHVRELKRFQNQI